MNLRKLLSPLSPLNPLLRMMTIWGTHLPRLESHQEIAVAVRESSRPAKKRVGQRTPAKRVSSGPPPQKPTTTRMVTSKKTMFLFCSINARGLGLPKRDLLKIISKNLVLISVVSKKFSFLSLPLLLGGLGLVSGPPLWGSSVV